MLWDLNLIAVGCDHWNILCRVLISGLSLEERTLKDWILKAVLELAGKGEFAFFSEIPSSLFFWVVKSCLYPSSSYLIAGIKYLQSCTQFVEWEPQSCLKFVKQQFENHCHRMNRLLTVCVCGMRCVLKLKHLLAADLLKNFLILKGWLYISSTFQSF